jgi:2EXR family
VLYLKPSSCHQPPGTFTHIQDLKTSNLLSINHILQIFSEHHYNIMKPTTVLRHVTMVESDTVASNEELTFTYFPKLPVELRLKVWGYCLPGPREITLICRSRWRGWESPLNEFKDGEAVLTVARSTTKPLALLAVNFESRTVTLKCYQLHFGTLLGNKPIYFDPELDTLRMHSLEVYIMLMFTAGWIGQTEEQKEEMKAVRSVTQHFSFHDAWGISHLPKPYRSLPTFDRLPCCITPTQNSVISLSSRDHINYNSLTAGGSSSGVLVQRLLYFFSRLGRR